MVDSQSPCHNPISIGLSYSDPVVQSQRRHQTVLQGGEPD